MTTISQFDTLSSMLTIVPTPIGNLKDLTFRSLEILKTADGIICEDSRRAEILLNHYQIKKPLLVLNDFNEATQIPKIIQKLLENCNLALISDAGTPLIADPGFKLVRECLNLKIAVDSLPGPTSITTALSLSGLPPDKFLFLGYPPEKDSHRKKLLQIILQRNQADKLKATNIFFISPHKLLRFISDIEKVFGDIEIVLAHELTKIHQSVEKHSALEWLSQLKNPKGEYILLFCLTSS